MIWSSGPWYYDFDGNLLNLNNKPPVKCMLHWRIERINFPRKKSMLNSSKFLKLQERQKESGLTVRSFCSNEGIAPSSFYYWLKKLNNEANGKRFIPLVVKSAGASINPFTQSELSQGQRIDDLLLEITYPNGITLRVKNDLDLAHLRSLVLLLD